MSYSKTFKLFNLRWFGYALDSRYSFFIKVRRFIFVGFIAIQKRHLFSTRESSTREYWIKSYFISRSGSFVFHSFFLRRAFGAKVISRSRVPTLVKPLVIYQGALSGWTTFPPFFHVTSRLGAPAFSRIVNDRLFWKTCLFLPAKAGFIRHVVFEFRQRKLESFVQLERRYVSWEMYFYFRKRTSTQISVSTMKIEFLFTDYTRN